MDAKVTGSSPSFMIRRGSAESTQKGGTGRFGVAETFARREPCLDSFRVVVGLQKDNRRVSSRPALGTLGMHHPLIVHLIMGSRIIYYEIMKREKYEDSDERTDSDLAIVKTRRYHFDDEPFIRPLHSIRSGPSRRASPTPQYSPLGPITRLGSPSSSSRRVSPTQGQQDLGRGRPVKSWELIPPSEGWMCKGDDVEVKGVNKEEVEKNEDANGIEEGGRKEEGVEEEEEDPKDPSEEEMLAFPELWMRTLTRITYST
ncbi:hypothetical protein PIB30_050861 [Stylosanthes scabra]|uniref:Uncharacterized protein n=1 Tax=Stylosanthes scabra TaxID=79078 RepID=A0ABU6QI98_9FABA|nr:hypothetical protein [Stylosanthes scabra]